jgi:hypothetical protein
MIPITNAEGQQTASFGGSTGGFGAAPSFGGATGRTANFGYSTPHTQPMNPGHPMTGGTATPATTPQLLPEGYSAPAPQRNASFKKGAGEGRPGGLPDAMAGPAEAGGGEAAAGGGGLMTALEVMPK